MRVVATHCSSREELVLARGARVKDARSELAARRGIAPSRVSLFSPSSSSASCLRDDEMCPAAVELRIHLRGGYSTEGTSYIFPAILTFIFVGCLIAGPVLVVRESNANLMFQTVWWVGIGLCIAAACLLLILIPMWIYVLCCD